MLDFFLGLSNKEKFTFMGILITAITSFITLLISLKLQKRTSYVTSITNERISSMAQLKINTANYIAMLKKFLVDERNDISVEKLYNLKLNIEFQLNTLKKNEKLIVDRMASINDLINYLNSIKSDINVEEIIEEVIKRGINRNRVPIPVPIRGNNRLDKVRTKDYLKIVISMEVSLLEIDLKQHIKTDWEKIKKEV